MLIFTYELVVILTKFHYCMAKIAVFFILSEFWGLCQILWTSFYFIKYITSRDRRCTSVTSHHAHAHPPTRVVLDLEPQQPPEIMKILQYISHRGPKYMTPMSPTQGPSLQKVQNLGGPSTLTMAHWQSLGLWRCTLLLFESPHQSEIGAY